MSSEPSSPVSTQPSSHQPSREPSPSVSRHQSPHQFVQARRNMSSAKFSAPPPFSFKPKDWPSWNTRFSRYRRATKLDLDDGERQVDALLYAMGEQSEGIFESMQ